MKQIDYIVTLEQTDVITDSENKCVTVNIKNKEVRPLIRCHECKYSGEGPGDDYWCYGFCSPARLVRKDDFCSLAVAKG